MGAFTLAGLVLSTLASEDAASIGAGILSSQGRLTLEAAIAACTAGVYLGDLSLWLSGRCLGARLLRSAWVARRADPESLMRIGGRLDTHLGAAVVLSRFVPGSRLPTYVAAGVWSRRPLAFAGWSLLAVLLWTPLLVVSAASFGSAVLAPLLDRIEASVSGSLLAVLIVWVILRASRRGIAVVVRRYSTSAAR